MDDSTHLFIIIQIKANKKQKRKIYLFFFATYSCPSKPSVSRENLSKWTDVGDTFSGLKIVPPFFFLVSSLFYFCGSLLKKLQVYTWLRFICLAIFLWVHCSFSKRKIRENWIEKWNNVVHFLSLDKFTPDCHRKIKIEAFNLNFFSEYQIWKQFVNRTIQIRLLIE